MQVKESLTIGGAALLLSFPSAVLAQQENERETEQALREELREIKARVQEIEQRLEEEEEQNQVFRVRAVEEFNFLTRRVNRLEDAYPEEMMAEQPEGIDLGGSLWLNYAYQDFDGESRATEGDFRFDLFRLSADGAAGNLLFSAQYRFYSFMDVIHHAWAGYRFSDHLQTRAGIMKVPFGLLPFASHSYWFGLPYYLGLEDDYDTGAKLIYNRAPWNLQFGFFKNPEYGDSSRLDRYSFDVVDVDQGNEEVNQLNARATYTFDYGDPGSLQLGVSGQWGELHNSRTNRTGNRRAAAVHGNLYYHDWNVQLQLARYEFDPRNPAGTDDDLIEIGAFADFRQVAAEGNLLVANIARSFDVTWGPISDVTCYNDFSVLFKDESHFDDSRLNTLGCVATAGPTYTYVDLIAGRNSTFLKDSSAMSGLGPGSGDDWEARFNVNLEYYF